MTTDSFTNTDGTTLSTHNANWAKANSYTNSAEINSNQVRNTAGFQNVAYYRSDSTSGDCQIVKKANAGLGNARFHALIRANATRLGYSIRLQDLSGDNFATVALYKNGTTYLASQTGLTISRLSDITMRIRATTNGGNQDIEAWINGTQVTWGAPTNSTIYSDGTSPYADGSPGFYTTSSAAQAESFWDDFDDLVSGASVAPLPAILPYYTLLQGG